MVKKVTIALAACWLFPLAVFGSGSPQPLTLFSPNHHLSVTFGLRSLPKPYEAGERMYYRVSYNGKPVLADSPLGLEFAGASALDRDLTVDRTSMESYDSTWQDRINDELNVRDHYHQLSIWLRERNAPHRRLGMVFRAYNSGVAFRYVLPRQQNLTTFVLKNEETGFYFARSASAFALELGKYASAYEAEFQPVTLHQIRPSAIVGLPFLAHLAGGPWVAILEADLENYAGLYVGGAEGFPDGLAGKLSPLPGHSGEAVMASTPKATPWRVVMVNLRPGGLIESTDLILNLNPPSAVKNESWIHPGKTAWDWWSGDYDTNVSFKPGMNTATLKHYVQFASDHHLPYLLIDAGWSPPDDITHWVPNVNLPQILSFAKQRHVRIILWVEWKAVKKQLAVALPLYHRWGVAGFKMDYMNRDDQQMVRFYYQVARAAARYHLVVDFHGAFKPTGMRRTYPNQLSREGVLGMEYSKSTYRCTPYHDVILPFTRMLAGPMDYTPGCFNNATKSQFKPSDVNPMCQGTRAHQLAMYVVYFSPLQMLSDDPEIYDHHPGMTFLDRVPTVWDRTVVLDGDPGQYVTIAREKGKVWYLGSMTNWTPRSLRIPLSFLGNGTYRAEIYSDGPDAARNARSLKMTDKTVGENDFINARLAPGGGLAAIVTPVAVTRH